jgi:hypothetical protein
MNRRFGALKAEKSTVCFRPEFITVGLCLPSVGMNRRFGALKAPKSTPAKAQARFFIAQICAQASLACFGQ